MSAADVEIGVVSGGYEEIAATLREYGPGSQPPAARLHGRQYLEAALTEGRGAILWSLSATRGSQATVRALLAEGFSLVQLRSAIHPFSDSFIGRKLLNPLQNRIDDRFLKDTVQVHFGAEGDAMHELGVRIMRNDIVRIAAIGAGVGVFRTSFVGGRLELALGAPTLAVLHGAPLLPLFAIAGSDGVFDVTIEPPLTCSSGSGPRDRAIQLAQAYADRLKRYVRRHPDTWRGWFMSNTWKPDAPPEGLKSI